jgi:hypothetical protein
VDAASSKTHTNRQDINFWVNVARAELGRQFVGNRALPALV